MQGWMMSDYRSRSEARQACVQWCLSLVAIAAPHASKLLHVMLAVGQSIPALLPVCLCGCEAMVPFNQYLPSKCLCIVTWLHVNCKICPGF